MACPIINYGIPESGATEYNINTGRELFRCGVPEDGQPIEDACVKLFITNVMLEASTVKSTCGTIDGAIADQVCMQSANVNWKDQAVINWIAKDGVDTTLPNGTVITRADDCAGSGSVIYTHTEGQISARVLANFTELNASRDAIILQAEAKLIDVAVDTTGSTVIADLEWILSDLGVNVSVTDWQGGTVTYQGFGTRALGTNESYRLNFNWQNGRGEESMGTTFYDESVNTALLGDIVDDLIAEATAAGFTP